MRKGEMISLAIGALIGSFIAVYAASQRVPVEEVHEVPRVEGTPVVRVCEVIVDETDKPEYYDVPLSEDLQEHIFAECEKHNIAPELVIAMIAQESDFITNKIGDDGSSTGLLQVQQKWHQERMKRLGCDNLLNTFQNVTVAVDYIAELKEINQDLFWVLMAYNGGFAYANERMETGNYSDYAVEVTKYAAELERE